jgi:hypothetical protein
MMDRMAAYERPAIVASYDAKELFGAARTASTADPTVVMRGNDDWMWYLIPGGAIIDLSAHQ